MTLLSSLTPIHFGQLQMFSSSVLQITSHLDSNFLLVSFFFSLHSHDGGNEQKGFVHAKQQALYQRTIPPPQWSYLGKTTKHFL